MFKATIKNVLAHKLRLALTALSVVLGVSFVTGTFVLGDTLNHTFDQLFRDAYKNTDVQVRSQVAFKANEGDSNRNPVPQELAAEIAKVPGVKAVEGSVQGYAQIIDKHGKAISPQAPTFGSSLHAVRELSSFRIKEGRPPRGAGEVAIDAGTAKKHDFHVGDRVKILFSGAPEEFTVSAITSFGSADNLAGATMASFDLPTAQRVLGKFGLVDGVDVVAADGVSPTQLKARIQATLPQGLEAVTGTQLAQENAGDVKGNLAFFTQALLVFAGISLFVGAFIIVNTFSILVAQRTRELAMLRALGASRRQVMLSVLGEAALVGIVASIGGMALGLLMASGLYGLLDALGVGLPSSALQFLPRTAVVAMILGVGVTVVAALNPARKASAVAPVAAMRDSGPAEAGSLRRRTIGGAVVAGLGVAGVLGGLFAGAGAPAVGLGAMLTFIGVTLLAPLVARPVATAIGAPLARFGITGVLGRENAKRNPRRTASTAAALMVGLGLVASMTVLGASIKASASTIVDKSLAADFIVSAPEFNGFTPVAERRIADQAEIDKVAGLRMGEFRLKGTGHQITGVDPGAVASVLKLDLSAGSVASMADGRVLVERKVAEDQGLSVGDDVPMEFAKTGVQHLKVGGLFEHNDLAGSWLMSTQEYETNYVDQLDMVVLAKLKPGVTATEGRAAIERATAEFPNLTTRDQTGLKQQQRDQINRLLGIIYALLGLSILIAMFGIVNTLALSTFERTRELGLLRAVGMQRRQIRKMVRNESVIIALFGSILGLAVGLFLGVALTKALGDQGITTLALPVGQLAVFLVVAGVLGLVAAVWPARRAARLDVLDAIATS